MRSINPALIQSRLAKWCSLQDRAISQAKKKLALHEISEEDRERILKDLIEQKYLDDLRFAQSYVRSKSVYKQWGEVKIRHHLKALHIDSKHINQACLEELPESHTLETLEKLTKKKALSTTDQAKVLRFLLQRGYPYGMAYDAVKRWVK
jgi:regulatory protein